MENSAFRVEVRPCQPSLRTPRACEPALNRNGAPATKTSPPRGPKMSPLWWKSSKCITSSSRCKTKNCATHNESSKSRVNSSAICTISPPSGAARERGAASERGPLPRTCRAGRRWHRRARCERQGSRREPRGLRDVRLHARRDEDPRHRTGAHRRRASKRARHIAASRRRRHRS